MKKISPYLIACAIFPLHAGAQVIVQDNLAGSSSKLDWATFNGACLTAGDGTGSIPSCVGLDYYSGQDMVGGYSGKLPDPAGKGALRLTNGYPYYKQNGAVVSKFTFPSGSGIEATFKTTTYWGNSGGEGKDGADGIAFFLMDGTKQPGIGAWGGSLGYTCSNTNPPYNGLEGAYLGLGIDEFGNFLNEGDNTSTGYGYKPGRIGLRGAGNISWNWLNKNYPGYYPSSLTDKQQQAAVKNTCKTGHVQDYSDPGSPQETAIALMNYTAIPGAYKVLSSGLQIAAEGATKRGDATVIGYKVKITQDGLLSFAYSYNGGTYQPVITNQPITASNGPLPSNFRFGFAGATGGSDNIHEITCFQAAPADQSSSSAGLNVQQSNEINTGSQIYLGFYHPISWWGQLTAHSLTYNAASGNVSIDPASKWDASCVLTGGKCPATGVASVTAESPSNRQIITWNGSQGVPFQWSSLSAAQQSALTSGDASASANRLNYLRGDRSNEINPATASGLFRQRAGVLGDIMHSSPTWVGAPASPYTGKWLDVMYPAATMPENGSLYSQFMSNNANRLGVVYAGANDGLLHAFRTGSAGNAALNDGLEVLAYMPGAIVQKIHNASDSTLDFSSTQYAHEYSVDESPGVGDLFYKGGWHTWLVGGLGMGGKAIYALDITNPSAFKESSAGNLVIGEWTPSTLTCANVGSCGNHLGNTYGVPVIRRLHNGNWGVIFANGLNSSTGHAGIYIMTVSSTGALSTIFLDTGSGSTATPNGITFATSADLDGDHVADFVYAGDVYGNVWRFDLTSSSPSGWVVSSFNGGGPSPLFKTNSNQPVTTKVMVAAAAAKQGPARVMIDFGTGREIPQTVTSAIQYASGGQSLYGIWDWNMSAWNTRSNTKYATMAVPQSIDTTKLKAQVIAGTYGKYRTVSTYDVCWADQATCTGANAQYGWALSLPAASEQIIYSPILSNGAFIVNTTIPATSTSSPYECDAGIPTGWTLAVSPSSGGAFPSSFFGDDNNNFVAINGQSVSGVQLNAAGSPSVVIAQKKPFVVSQNTSGSGAVKQVNPVGTQGSRWTWAELR